MNVKANRRPIILTFVRYYLPGYKAGGPLRTISNMVESLSNEIDFRIVTSDRDATETEPYTHLVGQDGWLEVGKAKVLYLSPQQKDLLSINRIIRETSHDALYLNSFFDPTFTLKPLMIRQLGIASRARCIIAPRGEFSPGALSLKPLKKQIFLTVARILGFHRDLLWQASSRHEAEDIRRTMGPVASEIRVAVNLPAPIRSRTELAHRPRVESEPLRVVFLSRISPMKNLDFALEVMKQVRVSVVFDIFGQPDDQSYWARCQTLISNLPKHISVRYHGSVDHRDVPATLARYDLFFLPTRGENYGHAIIESLAAGTPVLISDATPWRNLADKEIGWDFPLGDRQVFANCIDYFSSLSADQHAKIRKNSLTFSDDQDRNKSCIEENRSLFIQI